MTSPDRAQFLSKIESLDIEIGDALAAADLPELVALAGKAALVAATAMLYQQPTFVVICVCCDKEATHSLADWDVCQEHFNSLTEPWPGVDELAEI